MNPENILHRLINSNIHLEKGDPDHRRLYVIHTIIIAMFLFLSYFVYYNSTVTGNLPIVIVESITLGITILVFIYLKISQNIRIVSYMVMATMVLATYISFAILLDDHVLAFVVFIPITSYMLMGKKKGVLISILYYAGFLAVIYYADRWNQDFNLKLDSYINLSAAYIVVTLVIHYYELSRLEAYEKLLESNMLLEELTIHDELTGLYNRRCFNESLPREIYRAQRENLIFAFYMVDVDFFKKYNDTYGHLEGDEALISIAGVLSNHMKRASDYTFRLGGEEFGGFVIGRDREVLLAHIRKIREKVEKLQIPHEQNKPHGVLTVSIGIRIIEDFSNATPENIYRECDEALYRAKSNGRNRVEVTGT